MVGLLLATGALRAAEADSLADLSLQQLSQLEVTSVSRRAEPLADAPASVYVITAEDIRRSGALTLPEALRLAPNLEIARNNASDYAISARGFLSILANKMLVMIDGRSIYTPLFSGVFWDAQDVDLADVERIEVISGPGGTTWGSNAVAGVINIITKPASETRGLLARAYAGSKQDGWTARYGAPHFRVYAKRVERHPFETAAGGPAFDGNRHDQAGFRGDWRSGADGFTVQGDAYQGRLEQAVPGTRALSGFDLLGRWERRLDGGGRFTTQAYYDHTGRDYPGVFGENLDTVDLSLQHDFRLSRAQHLTWGAGYRAADDRVRNGPVVMFLPEHKRLAWWNLFAQDGIALSERLRLILGTRFENNPYTGTEALPSVRLAWKPSPSRLVWAAASRAVRSPSRIDVEFYEGTLMGGPGFVSEVSNVFELGTRAQPSPRFSYSVTAFYEQHDHIRSVEPAPGGGSVIGNEIAGHTQGIEAWADFQATRDWRLSAGGVLQDQDLAARPPSTSPIVNETASPSHHWQLRSLLDLGDGREFDIFVRRMGRLPYMRVPAYTAVDARYGWRLAPRLRASLGVDNLFDPSHPEFGPSLPGRVQIPREAYLRLTWRY